MIADVDHLLMCLLAILWEKNAFKILCPVFNYSIPHFVKLSELFLYPGYKCHQIQDFKIFFSLSVDHLFPFLIMSFESQKFLILMFYLSNISFVVCAFSVMCKEPLSNQRSQRFTPVFSSKSFMVLASTFRSLIHFELVFLLCVVFSMWCETRTQFHSFMWL